MAVYSLPESLSLALVRMRGQHLAAADLAALRQGEPRREVLCRRPFTNGRFHILRPAAIPDRALRHYLCEVHARQLIEQGRESKATAFDRTVSCRGFGKVLAMAADDLHALHAGEVTNDVVQLTFFEGCKRKWDSAGISTSAPIMFHTNMKVSRIPMSA